MCDTGLGDLLEQLGALNLRIAALRSCYRALQAYRAHPNYCIWESAMKRRASVLRAEQKCLLLKLAYGVY